MRSCNHIVSQRNDDQGAMRCAMSAVLIDAAVVAPSNLRGGVRAFPMRAGALSGGLALGGLHGSAGDPGTTPQRIL